MLKSNKTILVICCIFLIIYSTIAFARLTNQQFMSAITEGRAESYRLSEKYDTKEEKIDYIKNNMPKNDFAEIAIAMTIFMKADALKELCLSAGYAPHNFLNVINSYKAKNPNLNNLFVEYSLKFGATKEQAQIFLSELKDEQANILENEYIQIYKSMPTFTRQDYCEMYDINANNIISDALDMMKKSMPNAYKKYFEK